MCLKTGACVSFLEKLDGKTFTTKLVTSVKIIRDVTQLKSPLVQSIPVVEA